MFHNYGNQYENETKPPFTQPIIKKTMIFFHFVLVSFKIAVSASISLFQGRQCFTNKDIEGALCCLGEETYFGFF